MMEGLKNWLWWKKPKLKPGVRIYRQGEAFVRRKVADWTHNDFARLRKDWGNSSLVGWKIFYADGSVVRSTDTKFDDAPQDGVEVIKKFYRKRNGGYSWETQNGLELYVLYPDIAEQLVLPPQVKKGKNITNQRFDEILGEARADEEIVTRMI